ncbi:hypothetical protein T12_8039 [Trichinella patagoniensis]|uniref:Uncharacterized protein n=1 Tax=Trichinella patagoniensis TaxID=990121 RepID=A0A0V0YUC6_9BILA|nr:hypothetical protein T12_8039 [Trichinella patagoniensis]
MSSRDASLFYIIPVNVCNHWQMIVLDVAEQLSGKHTGCTSLNVMDAADTDRANEIFPAENEDEDTEATV